MTEQKQPLPTIDLLPYTRGVTTFEDGFQKNCRTIVRLNYGYGEDGRDVVFNWILAGQSFLNNERRDAVCTLGARMNVTDFEHDSAHAFSLPLIGFRFDGLRYQRTRFTAWIDPNSPEDFRIPNPDVNLMKGSRPCPDCKGEDAHGIIEQYMPEMNLPLYRKVAGKRVEILID